MAHYPLPEKWPLGAIREHGKFHYAVKHNTPLWLTDPFTPKIFGNKDGDGYLNFGFPLDFPDRRKMHDDSVWVTQDYWADKRALFIPFGPGVYGYIFENYWHAWAHWYQLREKLKAEGAL